MFMVKQQMLILMWWDLRKVKSLVKVLTM